MTRTTNSSTGIDARIAADRTAKHDLITRLFALRTSGNGATAEAQALEVEINGGRSAYESHSISVRLCSAVYGTDSKGRTVGGHATMFADVDGTVRVSVHATRDGKVFGSSSASAHCATLEDAHRFAAVKLGAQGKRYARG